LRWAFRWAWSGRGHCGGGLPGSTVAGGQVVAGVADDAVVEMGEVIGWPPVPVWRMW
jgi:hypothetical protein